MSSKPDRASQWAAGAAQAAELDRRRAWAMTPAERVAEGLDLVRIAEKLAAGRRGSPRSHSGSR